MNSIISLNSIVSFLCSEFGSVVGMVLYVLGSIALGLVATMICDNAIGYFSADNLEDYLAIREEAKEVMAERSKLLAKQKSIHSDLNAMENNINSLQARIDALNFGNVYSPAKEDTLSIFKNSLANMAKNVADEVTVRN